MVRHFVQDALVREAEGQPPPEFDAADAAKLSSLARGQPSTIVFRGHDIYINPDLTVFEARFHALVVDIDSNDRIVGCRVILDQPKRQSWAADYSA